MCSDQIKLHFPKSTPLLPTPPNSVSYVCLFYNPRSPICATHMLTGEGASTGDRSLYQELPPQRKLHLHVLQKPSTINSSPSAGAVGRLRASPLDVEY